MHPSTGPTLLSEIYPQLASTCGFERADDVYEMTRGYVIRERRDERRRRVSGAWKAAALEFCLAQGIRSFNGVCETTWIPGLTQLDWHPNILGQPKKIDGYDLVAFNTVVTEHALAMTYEHYDFTKPVTEWRGLEPKRSVADLVLNSRTA